MKLTKGKISKLYNKKKQSLKKIKQKKITKKTQTFRKYKKLNLARKSIKNINYNKIGGVNEAENDYITFYGKTIEPEIYALNLQTGIMNIFSQNSINTNNTNNKNSNITSNNKDKINIFGKIVPPEIYDVDKSSGIITLAPITPESTTKKSSWFPSFSSSKSSSQVVPVTNHSDNVHSSSDNFHSSSGYSGSSSGYSHSKSYNKQSKIIPSVINDNLNPKVSSEVQTQQKKSVPQKPSESSEESSKELPKLTEDEQKQKDAVEAMDKIAKFVYKYYLKNQETSIQDPIDALQKASTRISDNIQKINSNKDASQSLATASQSLASISSPKPSAPPLPPPSAPPVPRPSAPPLPPPSAPPLPSSQGQQPLTTGKPAVVQGSVQVI
jgi:hypothetical protein